MYFTKTFLHVKSSRWKIKSVENAHTHTRTHTDLSAHTAPECEVEKGLSHWGSH